MKTLVAVLLILAASSVGAEPTDRNMMAKKCLEVWGYDKFASIEERMAFPFFTEVSYCVGNYRQERYQKRVKESREFLKKHPWYKGKNWKWEDHAEYTCVKNFNNGLTYCHKPIFIN